MPPAASDTDHRAGPADAGSSGGVQSVERAFRLLEIIADNGGTMGLTQLASVTNLAMPTIHRLVRTLVNLGYLRQAPSRRYALGPRLIRLGESSSNMLGTWARPYLSTLVDQLDESANLAMLDGVEVVYVAQAQSQQSMRMFTEVGRRVLPHCTAVGKAMLATLAPADVRKIVTSTGLPRQTEHTITDPDELARALAAISEVGYAVDDGEQELGVRCVAVAVPDTPSKLAMSVSGPATRMTEAFIERAAPLLISTAAALSADLDRDTVVS